MCNNVSDLSVMKAHCKTCPFRPDENDNYSDPVLSNKVIERNLFQSQQICHGTEKGPDRIPQNRCKGYYDFAFQIYSRMGLEPEKHLKNQTK